MNQPENRTDRGRAWQRAVISLLCGLHCSIILDRADHNLRQQGLLGPVQAVRVETAQFANHAGHWVEEPRQLSVIRTYNVQGRWTAEMGPRSKALVLYNAQGALREIHIHNTENDSLVERIVYTYDAQARRVATRCYEAGGAMQEVRYTYDVLGRLSEQITCDAVSCFDKIAYTYDSQGNLIEESFYYPDSSSIKLRLVHTYDEQGRRTQTESYDTHGPALGVEKTVETYDAKGNILELITYYTEKIGDEEGKPIPPPSKMVYTYEWDAHGNWVKQTQTLCISESGKLVCEPSMVTYRTITYYAEAEISNR